MIEHPSPRKTEPPSRGRVNEILHKLRGLLSYEVTIDPEEEALLLEYFNGKKNRETQKEQLEKLQDLKALLAENGLDTLKTDEEIRIKKWRIATMNARRM